MNTAGASRSLCNCNLFHIFFNFANLRVKSFHIWGHVDWWILKKIPAYISFIPTHMLTFKRDNLEFFKISKFPALKIFCLCQLLSAFKHMANCVGWIFSVFIWWLIKKALDFWTASLRWRTCFFRFFLLNWRSLTYVEKWTEIKYRPWLKKKWSRRKSIFFCFFFFPEESRVPSAARAEKANGGAKGKRCF